VLITRSSNCINTASGIFTLCKWPSRAPDCHPQRATIPDAVLIEFDLLMMSTTLLGVEDCNKLIIKQRICASSLSLAKIILRCSTVSRTSKKTFRNTLFGFSFRHRAITPLRRVSPSHGATRIGAFPLDCDLKTLLLQL
jgi:hypothetical protein